MEKYRKVQRIIQSRPTMEGAGVRLRRVFGFGETEAFDPFLLMDDFRGNDPQDYIQGFPWHPHRGIETITYVLRGTVAHGDSLGNQGVIGGGDVQWMTAGSGIIHQEMPQGSPEGQMWGFQLWANLPVAQKMMDPRYRDVASAQIPEIMLENGASVRIISGEVNGVKGPVQDVVIDPQYLDVAVPAGKTFTHPVTPGHTAFAYVYEGEASFGAGGGAARSANGQLALLSDGEQVTVTAGGSGVRFLLISGKPLREPVAWYGPIVMNTQAELQLAFEEYRNNTFIKVGRRPDARAL